MIIADFEKLKVALIEKATIITFLPLLKTLGLRSVTSLTEAMYSHDIFEDLNPDIIISTWQDLRQCLILTNQTPSSQRSENRNLGNISIFIWGPESYDLDVLDSLQLTACDLGVDPTLEDLYLGLLNVIERVKSSYLLN